MSLDHERNSIPEKMHPATLQNSTQDFRIVPMTEEHLDSVAALDELVFPNERWGREAFSDNIKNDYDRCFTAVLSDGTPVGFAMIRILDTADVLLIAVSPEQRRKGIGDALLQRLISEAGASRMLLEVRSENTPAVRLYEKNGFKTVSLRKKYYSDPQDDALIMQR